MNQEQPPNEPKRNFTKEWNDFMWKYVMEDPEGQKIFVEEYNRIMKHAPEAIEWLIKHTPPQRLEVLSRAMDIMKKGFEEREKNDKVEPLD